MTARKITGSAASKIDKAWFATANKRLVGIDFQLLKHCVQIALDRPRVLVRVHAEITEVAAFATEWDMRIDTQGDILFGCLLHCRFNFRHVFLFPERERRIIRNEIVANRRLGFQRRFIGEWRLGRCIHHPYCSDAVVSYQIRRKLVFPERRSNIPIISVKSNPNCTCTYYLRPCEDSPIGVLYGVD